MRLAIFETYRGKIAVPPDKFFIECSCGDDSQVYLVSIATTLTHLTYGEVTTGYRTQGYHIKNMSFSEAIQEINSALYGLSS